MSARIFSAILPHKAEGGVRCARDLETFAQLRVPNRQPIILRWTCVSESQSSINQTPLNGLTFAKLCHLRVSPHSLTCKC
jgi:hypothetical protein